MPQQGSRQAGVHCQSMQARQGLQPRQHRQVQALLQPQPQAQPHHCLH